MTLEELTRITNIERRLSDLENKKDDINPNRMTFGQAIEAVKKGSLIAWWKSIDRYIGMNVDRELRLFCSLENENYPWTPNNEEILREDWRIVG